MIGSGLAGSAELEDRLLSCKMHNNASRWGNHFETIYKPLACCWKYLYLEHGSNYIALPVVVTEIVVQWMWHADQEGFLTPCVNRAHSQPLLRPVTELTEKLAPLCPASCEHHTVPYFLPKYVAIPKKCSLALKKSEMCNGGASFGIQVYNLQTYPHVSMRCSIILAQWPGGCAGHYRR